MHGLILGGPSDSIFPSEAQPSGKERCQKLSCHSFLGGCSEHSPGWVLVEQRQCPGAEQDLPHPQQLTAPQRRKPCLWPTLLPPRGLPGQRGRFCSVASCQACIILVLNQRDLCVFTSSDSSLSGFMGRETVPKSVMFRCILSYFYAGQEEFAGDPPAHHWQRTEI